MLVCGVRPCVIVVRDSVIGHSPLCPQHLGRRHRLRLEQVSSMRCLYVGSGVWSLQRRCTRCTRYSRGRCFSSVGSMGGDRVSSSEFCFTLSRVLWVYAVCLLVRRNVLSGSGGREVLFGRDGQLSGVGRQVAVCMPELSRDDVGGDWSALSKCKCVFLSWAFAAG